MELKIGSHSQWELKIGATFPIITFQQTKRFSNPLNSSIVIYLILTQTITLFRKYKF